MTASAHQPAAFYLTDDLTDDQLLAQARAALWPHVPQHLLLVHAERLIGSSPELTAGFQLSVFPQHPVTGAYQCAAENPLSGLLGGLLGLFGGGGEEPHKGGRGIKVECRPEKSGPYRRVYSKPGYSAQGARVYLPTDQRGEMQEEKAAGHGDTAFIYMGGWGGRGGAVDAGFQHGRYGGGQQDDWAPFFLVQQKGAASAVTVATDKQAGGQPWRLLAGQQAELSFWVSAGEESDLTYLNMEAAGTLSIDGVPSRLTLRAPVDASFGWDPAGGDNILKRMTTIGQNYNQENLASGSFMRGVVWQDSTIGTSPAGLRPWTADDTGGYCSYPDPKQPEGQRADGQGSKWSVQYVDPANETDSVMLK